MHVTFTLPIAAAGAGAIILPRKLQQAPVATLTEEDCRDVWGDKLNPAHVCAGDKNEKRTSCGVRDLHTSVLSLWYTYLERPSCILYLALVFSLQSDGRELKPTLILRLTIFCKLKLGPAVLYT